MFITKEGYVISVEQMPTKIKSPPPNSTGYIVEFTTEEGWPIAEVHVSDPNCKLNELENRANKLLYNCLINLPQMEAGLEVIGQEKK